MVKRLAWKIKKRFRKSDIYTLNKYFRMHIVDEIEQIMIGSEYALRLRSNLALSDFGAGNYNTNFYADIICSDGDLSENDSYEFVGKIHFNLNHIKKAREQGITTDDYIDSNGPHYFKGVFDVEKLMLVQAVIDKLEHPPLNEDILIIHYLKIYPEYRGLGIAEKVVNLICHHFGNSCGLIMCPIVPFQFGLLHRTGNPKEMQKMNYEAFTTDQEMAYYKLADHFKKMGFRQAIGDTFFLEPTKKNIKPIDFQL